ncbi:hypothetical protein [Micromonospora sp. NBC_01796]|uniref:hypothetical protein n=1 Tax=Micromonospora sp. NBC_01796 TaxID=2975987 RepID=UPI002DD90ED1|nr:hypothetical protein [Micromonospora sp. NBC_01796]WSA86588.1 hypothetical protein OIE47_02895 [Micromonospora sp. NBC_01796]
MTSSRGRVAGLLLSLTAVAALGAGCGVISTVQNAVDTAGALSEFADRLGKAAALTYTAEYTIVGAEQASVTLAQQPPRSVLVNGDGRLITTPDSMIICDGGECQRTPNNASTGPDAAMVAGVAGPAFITPELALGMVAAAAIVPNTDVDTSERTIAGQDSLCADVTGIKDPQGGTDELLQDFSVCVTDSGVLASFTGTSNTGTHASIELVKFADSVDERLFAPPANATLTDLTPR